MTRMIERWFPCQDVSEASQSGWGSGNREAGLFPWFAKRPLAQAKAAVVTSLLPWPDDPAEQDRLRGLVKRALATYDSASLEIEAALKDYYPDGAKVLDPFSGRAMIPLEASHLGAHAVGLDYSHVATLAGALLADYPSRDWSAEPRLPLTSRRHARQEELISQIPFTDRSQGRLDERLLRDLRVMLDEIGTRWAALMADFYPTVGGRQPWGYLWAVSLPCQNCGHRFPIVGSLVLRYPNPRRNDAGQSFRIIGDRTTGEFVVQVHEGSPRGMPTRAAVPGRSRHSSKGRVAICPFCEHVHDKFVYERLAHEGLGRDELLVAADLDDRVGDDRVSKVFRRPTDEEIAAVGRAEKALDREPDFEPGVSARPTEPIPPGNTWTVQPSLFGARSYGDLCNARQTLGFVRLARTIREVSRELSDAGLSVDYTRALSGYAAAALVRKLRRSTRGANLQVYKDGRPTGVHDVFGSSESSISFSYDYFETGLSNAAGGWESICVRTLATVESQLGRRRAKPVRVERYSALALPIRDKSIDAVVTDPPYDNLIDYNDASDLFFVWLKRALGESHPELAISSDPYGLQEKTEEIIVKKGGSGVNDHRTPAFYDDGIARAFTEARRVVRDDGVVTIIFGHGDPDVWHRLLSAITRAELVLTGSWPARTEKGGNVGSANIVTTLTLACRHAPPNRKPGRVQDVDAEVRQIIAERLPLWDAAGLALTDQLMASAGPAMEVVGRYAEILDKRGQRVELDRYLPLARRFVEEAADIKVGALPLTAFDARSRFALFWVRANARRISPASEARWQRLASDLSETDTRGILTTVAKGVRFAFAAESAAEISPQSAVIDVVFAVARAWAEEGLGAVAEALAAAGRTEDPYFWAAVTGLSNWLPEGDQDAQAWTALVRNRLSITEAARDLEGAQDIQAKKADQHARQGRLFGGGDV